MISQAYVFPVPGNGRDCHPHHRRQPAKSTENSASRTARRTLYLVKQVQHKTFLRQEAALQPLGVSPTQFRILTSLLHGEKRSSAALSRMFAVKPQTMIKQIAIVEGNGLIERNLAKGNKRVLEATMTEAGQVSLRACDKAATAVEAEIFATFEPGELATYRVLMQKVLASLRRITILGATVLFGVFGLLCASCHSLIPLVTCRFFAGIGMSGAPAVTVANINEFAPRRLRAYVRNLDLFRHDVRIGSDRC